MVWSMFCCREVLGERRFAFGNLYPGYHHYYGYESYYPVFLIGVGLLPEVKDRRIVKVPTVSFTDKDIGNNALCINSQVKL